MLPVERDVESNTLAEMEYDARQARVENKARKICAENYDLGKKLRPSHGHEGPNASQRATTLITLISLIKDTNKTLADSSPRCRMAICYLSNGSRKYWLY
jgi:hypothetical protein